MLYTWYCVSGTMQLTAVGECIPSSYNACTPSHRLSYKLSESFKAEQDGFKPMYYDTQDVRNMVCSRHMCMCMYMYFIRVLSFFVQNSLALVPTTDSM